jgi:SAM-dependent methyltransferase
MSDWSAGYVADIGYTFGYYPELNPLRIKLAFLNNGLVFPEFGTACELGFGQGISANIHAAASVTEWHGTDFNPAQAGFAQELAREAGLNAKLHDEAFSDFLGRPDLPDFDYIGLHGIWSWISDENRSLIVEFIRRKLKVGGVLYISYNTLPGWATFAPMRHLMTEHAEVIGSEGRGIVSRIDDAIDFADRLLSTNPMFARANPMVGDRIKKLRDQNRHYLAHEYFNRDWHPMHFSTIAEWLEPAKVQFACSANYLDSIDLINTTEEQQSFLKEIPDPMFRESVRDFMVNQQFRRDYWVKGLRRLNPLEQSELIRDYRVMLISHRPDVVLKATGILGEVTMSSDIYNPILDFLSDHKVKTLGQIEIAMRERSIPFNQIIQAVLVLSGTGHVTSVQDDSCIAKSKKQSDRLNSILMNKSRGAGEISFLASPVNGGGFAISRFQQLFLLAMHQGKKQPMELAQFVHSLLSRQSQKILKDGRTLETDEENLAELLEQATVFATKYIPILRAMQIT